MPAEAKMGDKLYIVLIAENAFEQVYHHMRCHLGGDLEPIETYDSDKKWVQVSKVFASENQLRELLRLPGVVGYFDDGQEIISAAYL